jgi:TonB-linked SusC/RagA family outer membrane protein
MKRNYQRIICVANNQKQGVLSRIFMIILLLAFSFNVMAQVATTKINLNVKNAPISKVLDAIKKQVSINILYNIEEVNSVAPVTLYVKNLPLDKALEKLLEGTGLVYVVQNNTIAIGPKPIVRTPGIILKKKAISGKVLDGDNNLLPGTNVQEVGTSNRTSTNSDGFFSLQVDEGAQIRISYLAMVPKTLTVLEGKNYTVILQPADNTLKEVVLTGYQSVKKNEMAGAASTVKAKDLVFNGVNTIEQALQGKLPGVQVTNNSGEVGVKQSVRVRGTSTLLGNQEPVWVVDGIIQEDPLPFKAAELNRFGTDPSNAQLMRNYVGSAIAWLNPNDIEEITVLKDASSTAIYGVKAANGVILIITKRGQLGRAPSISYSTSFSTKAKPSYDKMNLMNSKERMDVSKEAWTRQLPYNHSLNNVGFELLLKQYLQNKISLAEFNAATQQLEVNNTDWFDLLYQTPLSQTHNFSISGGGTNNSYYGSFGANFENGGAIGNSKDNYTGTINFSSNINTKLVISARISGSFATTKGFTGVSPYTYASTTNRVISARNDDGSLAFYKSTNNYNFNVLNELTNSGNENTTNSLNSSLNLRYTLPKGFQFESTFGVGFSTTHGEAYLTEQTNAIAYTRGYEYGTALPGDPVFKLSPLPIGGQLSVLDNRNINYTWRNNLHYGHTFAKKHSVTALLGQEIRSKLDNGLSSVNYGYLPDRGKMIVSPPVSVTQINGGAVIANPLYNTWAPSAITDSKANYMSYYFSGGYTFDERYVFNMSIRTDASNRFGQDSRNKFSPVWAIGTKWNAAREHFFKDISWLSDLSFRATLGFQGNVAENFGPDLIARIPGAGQTINRFTGEPVLVVSSLPYANLRWEKTRTINLGADISLFKNRITVQAEYYQKNTTDLISMRDVPFESGTSQMPINSGDMTNRGYELAVNFVPVRSNGWVWSVGVNTSRNTNKIVSRVQPNPTWNVAKSGNMYVAGYPVSSFWVFDYIGLNHDTGRPMYNIPTASQSPDAKTDATAYMKYGGKFDPDFTAGINTSVAYKGFTISTNMYASLGGKKILAPMFSYDMANGVPSEYNNLPKDLVNRWRQPGDEAFTNIPSLPYYDNSMVIALPSGVLGGDYLQTATESPYTMYNFSTARVVDASFVKISDISLSYVVPVKIAKKVLSNNIRVGYTMGNVYKFVSKDYKGVDPEVASGNQPLARTHAFSLSITY